MRTKTKSLVGIEPVFISEQDAEIITGISHRTFQRWRLFNQGPPWYKLQRAVKYDRAELLAWVRTNARGQALPAVEVDKERRPS
jgi:hypothetical protein